MVEGVAGEEDHHDEQEEHGEENAEAEGQHDEHDEDGMYNVHHSHYCFQTNHKILNYGPVFCSQNKSITYENSCHSYDLSSC